MRVYLDHVEKFRKAHMFKRPIVASAKNFHPHRMLISLPCKPNIKLPILKWRAI